MKIFFRSHGALTLPSQSFTQQERCDALAQAIQQVGKKSMINTYSFLKAKGHTLQVYSERKLVFHAA